MQVVSSPAVRRFRRVSATIPVSLYPQWEVSQTGHDAYTVDFSRCGARVRTTFALSVGEMLGVVPYGDMGQAIPSRVVWAERSLSGTLAGLEFLEVLAA